MPPLRDTLGVLTKWLTKVKCSGIVYLARAPYNERSKRMNTIQELQKLREELIREIDEKFDWIIDEVKKKVYRLGKKRAVNREITRSYIR